MESSSDFIVPADFSSEWRNITLVKSHSRTNIYTATRYGRRFVLKALVPEIASLTDYQLQQEQEFQLGIQFVHPNIAATRIVLKMRKIGRHTPVAIRSIASMFNLNGLSATRL